jgi:CBS domain-containing protein
MTRVAEVMTRGVRTMTPNETIRQAAQAMEELDIGAIPVCDGDRILGMVTDRDLVVRGIAQGRPADQTPIRDVMTSDVCWVYEDQSVDEANLQMAGKQIRRMPVVDRDKHLVGMLSLGDVAVKASGVSAGQALEDISEPARPDRSGQSQASGAAGGGSSYAQAGKRKG